MEKKKVLFFVQNGVGGAERISVLIGKNMPPEEYDVVFYLTHKLGNSSIADFIPDGFVIKYIPKVHPLILIICFVFIIYKEQPYAVFSSVYNLSNKILLFRKLYPNVKVIIRSDNYLYTFNEKQKQFIKFLYPKADFIIAQTIEMKNEFEQAGMDGNKIKVIQNPIDIQTINVKLTAAKNPYPNDNLKHIVASGRFAKQKGFDLLVKAFAYLSSIHNNIDLFIIGDIEYEKGSVYKEVLEIVKNENIENRVHCLGFQKNPYPFIKYADCFVLSSRWEGLPNVLIESLYLGTPVAAFKCIPVIERIVEEGRTGFCAEKENIESLANAIIKSIELGRVSSSYNSNTINDFVELF